MEIKIQVYFPSKYLVSSFDKIQQYPLIPSKQVSGIYFLPES